MEISSLNAAALESADKLANNKVVGRSSRRGALPQGGPECTVAQSARVAREASGELFVRMVRA